MKRMGNTVHFWLDKHFNLHFFILNKRLIVCKMYYKTIKYFVVLFSLLRNKTNIVKQRPINEEGVLV